VSAWLTVRVQPGARRAGVRGRLADGTLKLGVLAPAEAGRANRALVKLLSELLDVGTGQVRLKRGAGARAKTLEIEGLEPAELERRIARALERQKGERGG